MVKATLITKVVISKPSSRIGGRSMTHKNINSQRMTAIYARGMMTNDQLEAGRCFITGLNDKSITERADAYVDKTACGCNLNRPGLNRMLDGVRAGKIGVIVLTDLARFTPCFEHLLPLAKVLHEHDVRVLTLDGLDTNVPLNSFGCLLTMAGEIDNG